MTVDEIASSEDEVLADKVDKSTRSVEIPKGIAGLSLGFIGGMFFCLGLSYCLLPQIERADTLQRANNKPTVMRMYRLGVDGIYVENDNSPIRQRYIKLNKYLDGIKDHADRDVEEALIKKAVGWYD